MIADGKLLGYTGVQIIEAELSPKEAVYATPEMQVRICKIVRFSVSNGKLMKCANETGPDFDPEPGQPWQILN
jgi:hypothetical protein